MLIIHLWVYSRPWLGSWLHWEDFEKQRNAIKSSWLSSLSYIWVNYNISQTWIKAHLGMIPLTNHDSSEGEQWGRYNLPRYIICIFPSSGSHDEYCNITIGRQKIGHTPKMTILGQQKGDKLSTLLYPIFRQTQKTLWESTSACWKKTQSVDDISIRTYVYIYIHLQQISQPAMLDSQRLNPQFPPISQCQYPRSWLNTPSKFMTNG